MELVKCNHCIKETKNNTGKCRWCNKELGDNLEVIDIKWINSEKQRTTQNNQRKHRP